MYFTGLTFSALLVHFLLCSELSGESKFQKFHIHPNKTASQGNDKIHQFQNTQIKTTFSALDIADIKNKWHLNSEGNIRQDIPSNVKNNYSWKNMNQKNYFLHKVLAKRSSFSELQNDEQVFQNDTTVSSDLTKSSFRFTSNGSIHIYNNVRVDNGETSRETSTSSFDNRNIRWFLINLHKNNNTLISKDETSVIIKRLYIADNSSMMYENEDDLLINSSIINNWYSSSIEISSLRELLKIYEGNSNLSLSKFTPDNNETVNTPYINLTINFNCVIKESGVLHISCLNVSLYSIGEHLSNETVILDISNSKQIKLLSPLFPHLKKLRSLRLSNNHHRFITKAFMGLDNLEVLDLSNNDIRALLKAFTYVPKLIVLNLANNKFESVKVVSNAVSHLNNLQNLTLDHNVYIWHITKSDLYNLTYCNLTLFSFFNSTLQSVEFDAFSSMKSLKILEISVNYLNEEALANITCGVTKNVEDLYFGEMLRIRTFPLKAINCLTGTNVRAIRLRYNHISSVPVLPALPNLRLLSMSNCTVEAIETNAFQNLPNLEVLHMGDNKISSLSSALSSSKNLKELHLEYQKSDPLIILNYEFQNLTHLERLDLSHCSIHVLYKYSLFGLKNLKHTLIRSSKIERIEDFAFETLQSLEELDLQGNGISTLSNFTFYGLNSLRGIYLTGNLIAFLPFDFPFQFLPSLSVILMNNNQIKEIPKGMFSNLEKLEILTIGNNKLLPWSEKILNENATIKIFDLFRNNIDDITEMMLSEFQQVTSYLDLSENPFNCSRCGIQKFQNFCLRSNLSLKLRINQSMQNIYSCVNPDSFQSENFFDFEFPEDMCYDIEYSELNTLVVILVCFFIIIIIIASICYTTRWYIRYCIFHLKTNYNSKSGRSNERLYKYDAFIIYNSADTLFVKSHLIPQLESQAPKYKLCDHQRDFEVGRPITENILDAIENSRRVILILTEAFIKSEWCLYELHLTQHKLFAETRNTLILIKLKDIDKQFYTKNISYIEKTRKCFTWTDSQIGQALFWEQIRKELGRPGINQTIEAVSEL